LGGPWTGVRGFWPLNLAGSGIRPPTCRRGARSSLAPEPFGLFFQGIADLVRVIAVGANDPRRRESERDGDRGRVPVWRRL